MNTTPVRCLAILGLVLVSWTGQAETLDFERLFTRPYIWGTRPEQLAWSQQNHQLVFLWNASGRRFLDLYCYQYVKKRLVRLTDLETNSHTEAYPMPSAGIESAFDVARDGRAVTFALRGDIYTVATDGTKPPTQITRTKESESIPAFSPDGQDLAFLLKGEIYLYTRSSGATVPFTTTSGRVREFHWSPDGRYLAYVTSDPARQLLIPNYSGEVVVAPGVSRSVAKDDPPATSLWVLGRSGGKPLRVQDCSYGKNVILTQSIKWSPDSRSLLWVPVHAAMKKLQIAVSELGDGSTRSLFEVKDEKWVYYSSALWSPDGQQVLFSHDLDGHVHLYRIGLTDAKPVQVTHGDWDTYAGRFTSEPAWVKDNIYFNSTEAGTAERHFYSIRPDGSGKEQLTHGAGLHLGQVAPDAAAIAYLRGSPDAPGEVYVGDTQVTHSPAASFWKTDWPRVVFVRYPSRRDGKLVSAKLFLPADYHLEDRTAKPRPAVFFIHGGGYSSSVYREWGAYLPTTYAFNCYLAQQGYIVIDPDYRGSSGYGREWRTGVYLDMGGPDLDDVLGGIDYLRSLGNVNTAKLGIWGISYGGFMTNMALFKAPNAFQAGVAWSAVNNWANYLAWYTRQRLTTPQESPDAYRRSSPINFSQNLKDHLLMLHGMSDDNVLFQDLVQLTEKLLHENKSFDTFFYPEENHLYYRDESIRDSFRRTDEWFARYLGAAR